jgi:hypothetical protein
MIHLPDDPDGLVWLEDGGPVCPHCGGPLDVVGGVVYCPNCDTVPEVPDDDGPDRTVLMFPDDGPDPAA